MRPVATTRLLRGLLIFLCFPLSINAQYFIDASTNIPDADASYQSKDVMTADIDGDGDMDIILANEFQRNVVLLNNGLGLFSQAEVGIPANEEHDSEAVAMADFNLDGNNDLIFVSEDDFEHEYYWSNGNGGFEEPPLFLPYTVCRALLAQDFNSDGVADLMLGNNGQNMMLINNGLGEFINQTFDRIPFADDATQDIITSDVDGDGDLDIFAANEGGNKLLINNGSDVYLDESANRLPQGINMDTRTALFEDVDLDGDVDLFLCNVEFVAGNNAKNRLWLNDGNGNFTDATEANLPAYTEQTLDAIFTDVNLDGYPDLLISNVLGIPMGAYFNNGQGKFNDATAAILGEGFALEAFGVAKADFNNDGYEDIYIANRDGKDVLLMRDPNVVSTNDLEKIDVQVFPNPIRNSFTLSVPIDIGITETGFNFQILDAQGKVLTSLHPDFISAEQISFTFPTNLIDGLYFLSIRSDAEFGIVPLVIAR